MALIDLTVSVLTNVVAIRANNAPEMKLALDTFFAGADPALYLWDAHMTGGGASPNFLCSLTVGSAEGGGIAFSVAANDVTAVTVGGMDGGVDPVAMASILGFSIRDSGGTGVVKTQIACGGVGPHWMGLALLVGVDD